MRKYLFCLLVFTGLLTYSQGIEYIDSLMNVLKIEKDFNQRLSTYKNLLTHIDFGDEADRLVEEYCELANRLHVENDQAFCSMYVGLYAFNRNENYNALSQINRAIEGFQALDKNPEFVQSLLIKGRIFDHMNHRDSTLYYYKKALTKSQTKASLYDSNYQMGLYYMKVIDFKKSISYLEKAQDLAVKLKDSIKIGKVQYRIGNLNINEKNYDKASSTLFNSLKVLKRNKASTIDITNNLFLIGNYFFFIKKRKQAVIYYKKALAKSKKTNTYSAIGYTLSSIGSSLIHLKDYDAAEKYLDSAVAIQSRIDNKKYLATTFTRKALLAYHKQDLKAAINYTNKSLIINQSLQYNKNVYIDLHNLGYLHNENGNSKLAYKSIEKAFKYKDTVLKDDYLKELTKVQTKYETQQKENKILELSNKNNKQKASLAQSRMLNSIGLSASLLVLGSGFFFWHRKKQQQKLALLKHSVEAGEQEKKRIGKELHDGIAGSLIKLVHDTEDTNMELSDKLLYTYNEIRNLSHQLDNTPIHDEVFMERILDLIPQSKKNRIFSFKISPNHLKLNEPYGTHVYRIIQELITNNLKHSQATKTSIDIKEENNILTIKYEDNGVGIKELKKGNGYQNMEDRIEILDGELNMNNTNTKGLSLGIAIPYT